MALLSHNRPQLVQSRSDQSLNYSESNHDKVVSPLHGHIACLVIHARRVASMMDNIRATKRMPRTANHAESMTKKTNMKLVIFFLKIGENNIFKYLFLDFEKAHGPR